MPKSEDTESQSPPLDPTSHKSGLHLQPEIIPPGFSEQEQETVDPGRSLDEVRLDAEFNRLRRADERLEQKLHEAKENHQLRQRHAKKLFILAITWISILWIILLIQGFGKFPFPSLLENYENLEFKLSDSVLIAFMTSTTTTVVGLYGIAAYWLFRAPRKKEKEAQKKSKDKSEK